MPLVPEKLNSRQEVRNAISSQFWDQPVHSVRSLDGTARTLPCEPPPIGQTAASGLLRSQELLATQAAGLTVMPGFSSQDGGLVLDRVLARAGRRNWWTTLSGRARAQQMWGAYRAGLTVGETLKDLENYSLSSRSRVALGRNASLNYVIEAPNAKDVHRDIKQKSRRALKRGSAEQSKSAYKSQAWLKYHLPGHDVVGTAAWNQDYVDSAASYCTVPTTVSCDLASKDRPDGIQYRVGLHQVSAAEVEGSSLNLNSLPNSSRASAQARSSVHVQGAVAVEGEAHIWRPGRKGGSNTNVDAEADESHAFTHKDGAAAGQGMLESASEIVKTVKQEIAAQEEVAAQGVAGATSQSKQGSQRDAAKQAQPLASQLPIASPNQTSLTLSGSASTQPSKTRSTLAHAADTTSSNQSKADVQQKLDQPTQTAPNLEQPSSSAAVQQQSSSALRSRSSKAADARPRRTWPSIRYGKPGRSGNVLVDEYSSVISDSEDSDAEEAQQPVSMLRNVSANMIQSNIREAQANIEKLRQVLTVVSAGVQEGKVQQEQQNQMALTRKPKRKPYSPWLSQPFLKVNAAVGCLARMPLPHSAFRPLESRSDDTQAQGPLDGPPGRFSADLWQPYLRDTALRIFGSVGLTGQLGRFTRPVLDFTAGSVRLDFGLTSPHRPSLAPVSSYGNLSVFNPRQDHLDSADLDEDVPSSSRRLGMRFKNRAFALEGRGIWHALSASVTQQVIGPIRLRGDIRCALDLPSSVEQNANGKRTWRKFREAAQKTRPTLLETTIGLDIVIPGSSGIARAAVWYSHHRKEGMAEVKLF